MKVRSFKLLSLVLVVFLILSAFAGCKSKSSNGNVQEQSQGQNDAQQSEEKTKITLFSWRVEEIEAFKKMNAEFNKEYPNIEVIYEPVKATEYDSQLNTKLASGNAAEMVYVRPFDTGLQVYKAGYLQELTEKEIPNLKNFSELQKSIYADENNNLYGLPYMYITYGYMYNKDLFAKYSLEEPETWDDFFKICDTLKSNSVTPIAMGTKDVWPLSSVISDGNYASFVGGEDWRQKLLKGEVKLTDPEFIKHLETINSWKNYLPEDFAGIGYLDAIQLFSMGDAAIYPSGSFDLGFVQSQNPDFEIGIFAPPVLNKGDKRWASLNGGAGLGVVKDSKNSEAAFTYINWLASEKGQTMTGDLMPGLFPCANMDTSKLQDELAKEWIGTGGQNGENFAICWGLQLNKQEPSASSLTNDCIALMLQGKITPQQAAETIQKGIASWYEPFKE